MSAVSQWDNKSGQGRRGRRLLRSLARLLNYDLFEPLSQGPTEVLPSVRITKSRTTNRLGDLPQAEELYRLFDLYNAIHFDSALPKATIEYSTRMLSAGSCEPLGRRIKIGVRYHQIFREELADTLKHEMIHLIHFHHDKRFKAKAAEMGVPVHAKFHPSLKRPPRYLYQCPACKTQYPRQRRLRETSCGSCSGGVYERRFKLLLVSKAAARRDKLRG